MRWLIGVAVLAALGGCAGPSSVRPVTVSASPAGPAVASAAGLTVAAPGQTWGGEPPELPTIVTPIYLEVRNDGPRPVRLAYDGLRLTVAGRSYRALAPAEVAGGINRPLPGAPFCNTPGGMRFAQNFLLDCPNEGSFFQPFPAFDYVALPTSDMLRSALPAGTIEPGRRIAGFVFFQRVGGPPGPASLEATASDAASGAPVGPVSLPIAISG
jgi:hypothetical protein